MAHVNPAYDVFISHSLEDTETAGELADALRVLERRVFVESYSRLQDITWLDNLLSVLTHADLITLLCSHAYLDSAWGNLEMGAALGRAGKGGPLILPILQTGVALEDLPASIRRFEVIRSERMGMGGVASEVERLLRTNPGLTPPSDMLVLVYDELCHLATKYIRSEPEQDLEPAELVHEAYLRLIRNTERAWQDKDHFFAVAAVQMRRILVDHARYRDVSRRGGGGRLIVLSEDLAVTQQSPLDILALDEALLRLSEIDSQQSQVAELRLFSGLTEKELAEHLGISEPKIREDWRAARAWLARELSA